MVGSDIETTVAVVQAVAKRKNVDPVDLEPLNDAVDTESLERIFRPRGTATAKAPGHVQFVYEGYEVTVHSTDEVEVREQLTNPGHVGEVDSEGNV